MASQPEMQHNDPVVAAIERVLKTERDGVEALKRSREEAGRLLTQARAEAAALTRRADLCISRLHANYLQKIEREIEQRAATDAGNGSASGDGFEKTVLAAAARRAAAKLTGGA
jgi:vacuolar-type H+-ATPase subunit H